MKNIYFSLILLASAIYSCSNNENNSCDYDKQNIAENKFKDVELQKIYNFQNSRDTKNLIPYLKNSNPIYRDAAAMAFASVQDSNAVEGLIYLLKNDKSIKNRQSAAYAIGQTSNKKAQKYLMNCFLLEKIDTVKFFIGEAIGKCGDTTALAFLSEQLDNKKLSRIEEKAVFMGLARLYERQIISKNSTNKLINRIKSNEINQENLYIASIALAKLKNYEIDNDLISIFDKTDNIFTKLNLINALSEKNADKTLNFLHNIVNNDVDYRLKVNAINAMLKQEYSKVKPLIIKLLNDKNTNVSIKASEFIMYSGKKQDSDLYLQTSKKTNNWRTSSNLLSAALKYGENKANISEIIKNRYNNSNNDYEKAYLLSALGNSIGNYKFVASEVHKTKVKVVSTYGMKALSDMCKNKDFKEVNKKRIAKGNEDLKFEFAFILKDAIMSKDAGRVSIAAEILRNSKLNFAKEYENTYFLTQALNNCELPKDLEAYIELQKTIAFLENKQFDDKNNSFKKAEIDWKYTANIPYNQKVKIETSEGYIIVELHVNETPVSVTNFLKLAENHFFDDKHIHRVVPNFVLQDGCPRGDGWGSPDYTIYSEFPINYYKEGSLGMASAGKDTEASQWFITHLPTPQLDGRYTNFGTVIEGMDVVHRLKVGDRIIKISKI